MKMIKKLVTTIQEDIVGTDNRFIAIVWLLCLSGVIGLGFYLSSESRSFLGVADSREQQISFEYPVEIKKMHVMTGQNVRKGELLMELDQSELNEKIRLVNSQLAKLQTEKLVRRHLNLIVNNSSKSAAQSEGEDPLSIEIADLEQQVQTLEEQRKNLYVFAEVDGIVGAVNFRMREKAPAFSSIITLSPENPTFVEGFIHESLQTKLTLGDTVRIVSSSSGQKPIEGTVVSVGSRIITIPTRLMTVPNMQVYGREVVVEIPKNNGLLLGEKVQIKPKFDVITISQASASEKSELSKKVKSAEPLSMVFPPSLEKRFQFEPSGAIYLDDLKKFLVISDDTDKQKSAALFLVNRDGKVDEQFLTVPGVGEVSDFESISQSGDMIYLLASQGFNKKGKDKEERNVFIRVKREGLTLSRAERVDFKPMLLKAIGQSKDASLKTAFSGQKFGDIDIESHFTIGKDLYLGFKHPITKDNESVIIKITDLDLIFTKKELAADKISMWRTLNFTKVEGLPHRLSDLVNVDGQIYAATVCKNEDCGAIWKLPSSDKKAAPQMMRFFKDLKPEGMAFDSKEQSLFVTFDLSLAPSKFAIMDLKGPVDLPQAKVSNEK